MPDRLPDLVVIGAMKSATTTLYRWLVESQEVFFAPKETNFFSGDEGWARGVSWYESLFSAAPAAAEVLGDASVAYSDPERSAVAAERMASVVPRARLVFVVRQPVERIRSHYRHELQRGRETRSLAAVLAEPGNAYLANSSYFRALEPYAMRFPREQILVIRFEDLVRAPFEAWDRTLSFLGLASRPAPGTAHNVTRENAQWSPAFGFLKRRGLVSLRNAARLPAPVRRLGKRVLMRQDDAYQRQLDRAEDPIDPALMEPIWADLARLEAWLQVDGPLWPREETAAPPTSDLIR
jgi:hypothetical protein